MSRACVLVVEDEPHLAAGIRENLAAEGHAVEVVGDGDAALARWRAGGIDLMVLDVMLPRRDGYAVCRAIRAAGDSLPILFLTARNEGEDRIAGLEAGGDDYLGKPFHLRELLLRVQGMLRRRAGPAAATATVAFAGCRVDLARGEVTDAEGRIELLPRRELQVLELLLRHAGEVVGREAIVAHAWGDAPYPASRTVEAIVARLRGRFEPDPGTPRILLTVPGIGYRLVL